MKNKVHGVGINNADYKVSKCIFVSGKSVRVWMCPFYSTWCSMLSRCYSQKYQARKPTYIGCTVCDEWLVFSSFKSWMEKQDWQGKHLDKDVLNPGNKVYSPENCLFLTPLANTFFSDAAAIRGEFMIGVCFDKERNKFAAKCCNPFTKKVEFLGRFDSEIDAHNSWLSVKLSHAKIIASQQSDDVAANAVATFYHRTTAELVNVCNE